MNHSFRLKYRTELLVAFLVILLQGNIAVAVDLPPSTNPPGGLAPSNTPQIVLLTFDDSVTVDSLSLVQQALTNHFNPNGDSIKATFFVSMDARYDPYSIRQLYDAGHEIALHTMSHQTGSSSSLFRWWQEIAGEKRSLSELCGIPLDEITGFRAPYLASNDNAFRVLSERQFRYDSNFPESLSGLSTTPSNMIWPYTLDHGLMQSAPPAYSPNTNYPGLFEIPLWVQFTNMIEVTTMDPPETFTSNAVVELWKTNFLEHYNGNRAPYGIYLHATSTTQWLSNPTNSAWRIAALREFIDWALTQPDTWFVTCNDLVDYMIEPVSAQDAVAHPVFQTPVRPPFPTSEVTRCSIAGSHIFYACGPCPLVAPNYTNATLKLAPIDGSTLTLNVVSQSVDTAWCVMVVSNNTPNPVYDWAIGFTLGGGNMLSLADATWTQSVDQVSAIARSYNRKLYPFDSHVIDFRVERTGGEVTFDPASIAVIELGGAISTDGSTDNDFDGDGSSDLCVYYPPIGKWYIFKSTDGYYEDQFGYNGTKPITGDFDGDGVGDFGVYYAPLGKWYIFKSTDGFYEDQFGYAGTIPITGDFDGDDKCDFGCYHPPTGNWYTFSSTDGFQQTQFGFAGTIPVTGDFDGDGKCDFGYYHPPTGVWKLQKSTGGFMETVFGYAGTIPVTGDFDGDGVDDFGCYYAPGGNWYIFKSSDGYYEDQFGYAGTDPIVGDFDGDGRSDIGCYYAPGGNWYVFGSTSGFYEDQFGYSGTIPIGTTQTEP